jgi:ABC-2 type transport system permease protein
LMAVFFGGLMLPASALIHEKQKHTMEALNVTPATVVDIFLAKGCIGALLALMMGLITLTISGGFGGSPFALILVLGLGAVMAAEIGLLAGAFIKDMNTLYAIWKFGGLLLFGPAIVFMFPGIPTWIGYIFPTYYVVKPVMDLSVNGLGFGAVILNLMILAGIVVIMGVIVSGVARRLSAQALRLNG